MTTMVMMLMRVTIRGLKPTMKIHNNAEDDVVHNDNDVYLHMMNHHDEDDTAVRNDSEDCLNCSCRRGAHILVYTCRTAGVYRRATVLHE